MRYQSLFLICGALAVASPGAARAEPAVLYVPDIDVELNPSNTGVCSGVGQSNSAHGCVGSVDATEVVPPHPNALMLRTEIEAALAAYDVHLADTRPPEYLHYTMLLPSTDPLPGNASFTCSGGSINCGARDRNDVIRTFGPTDNCLVADLLATALYVFGRSAGLEGVLDPADAMHYPPEFVGGAGSFVDGCSLIVNQMAFNDQGELIDLPLECPSIDHTGCVAGEQNSHADLIDFFGPRVVDIDPPMLTNLTPADGSFVLLGDDLVMDVDIMDADPVVGGRWTIASPALEAAGLPGGVLTICTNDICDASWDDAAPLKPTQSDWSMIIANLPEGVYTITFEASDYHGNEATPTMAVVEVTDEIPPGTTSTTGAEDTGPLDTSTGDESDDGVFTTGMSTTSTSGTPPTTGTLPDGPGPVPGDDDGTGSTGAEQDGDGLVDHGCACRSSSGGTGAGAGLLLLVLAGLRRRRVGG